MSSPRFIPVNPHSRNPQEQAKENEFETSLNSLQFPPPRTPLNAIPDPAQQQNETHESHFDSQDKTESTRGSRTCLLDKKLEVHPTPRVCNRNGKPLSEPNSAQSTPARSGSRVSLGGGYMTGPRSMQFSKGKEVSSHASKVSRGISVANSVFSVDVPHFELDEDHSFWTDHNVQVLIRVRPLNEMEVVSQGYSRCLRQENEHTLVWLGHPETRFTFDHVACETISQEKLFRVAGAPMVDNCMSGYHSCMFAYGQTGSGKTHTMMGEINQIANKLSQDCGITPRIFEYLFTMIRMEEESRIDEKLKFSCKCSFLEIYNEQITDLLEPSSTNLQLREDSHKGVYVENLTECDVRNVNDVTKLLLRGAANRKMAATHMNSESSRSHSVFTCVIESWWEKDSMTHFRFARLNLVDLAGSERQKSSGAEGDRLKEAANINKSLSTLGLVIMSLVDLANGKQRHVPYRDSRLTFLLQDSLGGNSKTTIIANVSPSICSANETLSTLKFAQRAKLIQNDAKVNEDASGDVGALQQQIQQLKDQLSFLMKHQNLSGTLSNDMPSSVTDSSSKATEVTDKNSLVEKNATRSDFAYEVCNQLDDTALQSKDQNMDPLHLIQSGDVLKELWDAKLLIEQIKSEKVQLIEELKLLQKQNRRYMDILRDEEHNKRQFVLDIGNGQELDNDEKQNKTSVMESPEGISGKALQGRLDKLAKELEEARLLNCRYQDDQTSRLSEQHQIELVREQVEIETANTILHLQEEVTSLQWELNERLQCISEENTRLQKAAADKDREMKTLCGEWESAMLELTSFLLDGSKSLKDASGQIESIVCSFPSQVNALVCERVERAARACIDKEETILQLEKSLEDAQKMVGEMELKLISLREATMVLKEFQQSEKNDSAEDASYLSMLLDEKINMVKILESKLKFQEDLVNEVEKRADAAFVVVKWLNDCHEVSRNSLDRGIHVSKLLSPTTIGRLEASENATNASQIDVEQGIKDNQLNILGLMRDDLAKINDKLKVLNNCIFTEKGAPVCLLTGNCTVEADDWSADDSISSYSTSSSESSSEGVVVGGKLDGISHSSNSSFSEGTTEPDMQFQKGSLVEPEPEEDSKELLEFLQQNEAVNLRKELDMTFHAFRKLYTHLVSLNNKNGTMPCTSQEENKEVDPSSELTMKVAEVCCNDARKVVANDKVNHAIFLSKCEEACATMKEADYMLNALLKANEKAKQSNGAWKQASEKLMAERFHLIEENERLKSSICVKEDDLDEINHNLLELAKSITSLEGFFQQMQRDVDKKFKNLHSDALSMGREMLNFMCKSRSSVEEIYSKVMENGFVVCVLYQRLVEEVAQKVPSFSAQRGLCPLGQKECHQEQNELQNVGFINQKGLGKRNQMEIVTNVEGEELALSYDNGEEPGLSYDNIRYENLSLKKELERKEVLLKGLLFDFSLLQETISNRMDVKDETEKLILALGEVRHELMVKTSQLDHLLVKQRKLEDHLMDSESALSTSNSDLDQARETIDDLSEQNADLRALLKDLYLKKSEAEDQLEEQKEVVKGLEKEIIHLTSSAERKVLSAVKSLEEDLCKVANERDQLREEIYSLSEKLDMAYALADENEAIAVEARQESEASKTYAEQKEEEVKILEHSVEELERTINVLEEKVYGMNEEVEGYQLIKDSLEKELKSLRLRLSTVENIADNMDSTNINSVQSEDHISRLLELHDAMRLLQEDMAEKDKEIKQYKDHIKELVLHSEAQASQYQEKYKTLEAMIQEVKTNLPNSVSMAPKDKSDKSSMRSRGSSSPMRSRGSGSPFRCIAGLVHQMSLEKDQELAAARLRIEEQEALLACRQKEVCILNTRLAAAESMTHDVIRDLLCVKLDLTNYADLIDQHQVQKLVEEAHHQTEEFLAKEQEILNLRKQINELTEERESCISEINKKAADILEAEVTVEQLQERDQLLSAQNEMLKMDKSNLLRRVAELDEMVKTLLGTESAQRIQQTSKDKNNLLRRAAEFDEMVKTLLGTESAQRIQQTSKTKEKGIVKTGGADLTKRVEHSERLISRVNDELAQFRRFSVSHPLVKTYGHNLESRHRFKGAPGASSKLNKQQDLNNCT